MTSSASAAQGGGGRTADWASAVLPHGPLVQLAPRLWQLTGALPRMALPRNMTIWRMEDGGLCVHGAVACDAPTLLEIEALGPPRVLLVPSASHRRDAAAWKARFPELRVVCPEAARARVTEAVAVDASDTAVAGLDVLPVPGLGGAENAYRVDAGAGVALVFCDVLFNVPHQPGMGGLLLRLLGSTGGFGMTPVGRWLLLKDAAALSAWLREQAADPRLALVCVAHGEPVLRDPAVKLREAAERL